MPRVVVSPAARTDLTDIWRYIADDNPAGADEFLDLIERTCRVLADYPFMGRNRPELAAGVHSFPIARYIVFYRSAADGVEVVRVLHGARDIGAAF